MHCTKELLLEYLSTHACAYTLYTHSPLFTCEQAAGVIKELNISGVAVKNLFLKDNNKRLYLISAASHTHIDLKAVGTVLDAKGLRFADATLLMNHLRVAPGSVTPLALINDKEKAVQPIIDAELLQQDYIQIHPMQNDATVVLTPNDLLKFLSLIERSYIVYDFGENKKNHI